MNFIYVIHLMCWNYLITENRNRNSKNRSNSVHCNNKGGAQEARAPFIVSVPAVASVLSVSVSVVCDQVDQVVPAHQADDIGQVHELDPVHQVDHKDEYTDFCYYNFLHFNRHIPISTALFYSFMFIYTSVYLTSETLQSSSLISSSSHANNTVFSYAVYDLNGKVIIDSKTAFSNEKIQLNLPMGQYLLKIKHDHKTIVKKIAKVIVGKSIWIILSLICCSTRL